MLRLSYASAFLACACACLAFAGIVLGQSDDEARRTERVRALLKQTPLIDGHNDLPWAMRENAWYDFGKIDIRQPQPKLMTDIPRLRAGGLGGQFWSVYVPAELKGEHAVTATLEQIDAVHELARRYPDTFALARTADDVETAFKAGKIASLIGMEGGHSIDNSLGALRMFARMGAAYMTLTHGKNLAWADSATDGVKAHGLTRFGEEVVHEMNRLGMLVDLSHVSPETMDDALRVTEAPVIFSHSSARALCDVPRNVPDDILERLPRNGGVVMVTFVPGFISPDVAAHTKLEAAQEQALQAQYPNDAEKVKAELAAWNAAHPAPKATVSQIADHVDHIKQVAGIDHIGIGSDFDGITSVPAGLEDTSKYPVLFAELARRGYSDEDLRKIAGQNVLRVMRRTEAVAKKLQETRGPSLATIESLDGEAAKPVPALSK